MKTEKIILASQSPRRAQILALAHIPFEVIACEVAETINPKLSITEIPIKIAEQKATPIIQNHPDRVILAADTIVVLENKIIGKPKDKEDAFKILTSLSNKSHTVITGVSLYTIGEKITFSVSTEVTFKKLSQNQILYYIEQCKPYDKAGAYAIQEWIGAVAIQSINGCFYNVMGLPISKIVPLLSNNYQ